ncbi:MAG TPA: pilus assembly protein HicB [Thermoanaerobaculia bacterium]|nr:pilus assembly protein HicB [Thermoanaerobaculia bacterium]
MSKSAYPLKMPKSVKEAAARLAKADGVSLNQFIAVAVAEKVGALETAEVLLRRRAAEARPADLMRYLRGAPDLAPAEEDSMDR